MRDSIFVILLGTTVATAGGCAAIHGLDEYTTAEPKPLEGIGADPGSTVSATLTDAGALAPTCRNNRECVLLTTLGTTGDATPAVCIKATGRCEPLTTPDCPRFQGDYENDDAVVVGTLLGRNDASDHENAAFMAAAEINAAGGLPPTAAGGASRPLVVVGCNLGTDPLRGTRHLVEGLRVPAIVGPTDGDEVVDVTQQVSARGGSLVMTPTAVASSISNLADSDLTWRAIPSDAQRAKLIIEQVNALEALLRSTRGLTSVKLAIVHSSDALGTSARDAVRGKLILNTRFLDDAANAANVSIDAYPRGDAAAQGALATKYATTFKPDIVFVTSEEQLTDLVLPLEAALTAGRAVARPYYVMTDASKTPRLLETVVAPAAPLDIKRRIRGVGVKPDATSGPVLDAFRTAYTARFGAAPGGPAALSYDATYAFAYAIAATSGLPLTGSSVAQGLRTLRVGDAAVVGSSTAGAVMKDLSGGKSVSLRGTFGLLHWDTSGDIQGGTVEVWCLGTTAGAPTFGSSGLTMAVETQVVGGAFVQCQ